MKNNKIFLNLSWIPYVIILFEMLYMASPFAAFFYGVYKLYPKEFLQLKNRKHYSETIDYVIEFGEQYFENYYPEMSLDNVVKCMKEGLPPFSSSFKAK